MKKQVTAPQGSLRFRRKPLITALEPRLLLDGAALATAVELSTDVAYQDQASDSTPAAAPAPEAAAPAAVAPVESSVEPAATTEPQTSALTEAGDAPTTAPTTESTTTSASTSTAVPAAATNETAGAAPSEALVATPSATPSTTTADSTTDTEALAVAPTATRRETVFVDSQVQDHEALVAGLGEGVEVHMIDAGSNGLEQIAQALQGQTGIDAIHIYSHGEVGQLILGDLTLSSDNLGQHAALLTQIGQSLSADADLLLYGCEVGSDSEGQAFIDTLAQLTGADVAASDDLTGAQSAGGDWDLEASAGQVDSAAMAVGAYSQVLATPVITQLSDLTYTEDSGAVTIDDNVSIGGSSNFSGGYIQYSITGGTGSETLGIVTSGSPNTAAGVVSIVGTTVHRGTGSGSEVIGSVDGTYNGQNGQALRINFSNAFANGSFQTGTSGDTVVTGWTSVGGRIRLDGSYQIAGQATPIDNTYSAGNTTGDYSTNGVFTQSTNLTDYNAGNLALVLATGDSSIDQPFGVVRGPAVYSNGTVALQVGDQVSFNWRALAGGDAYDAYGYMVDVNTGNTITILNSTGTVPGQLTNWANNNITIGAGNAGVYRFVFVAGSFDLSGGQYLGGQLMIDDVTVTQANPPGAVSAENMSTIGQLVTYQNTDQDFAPSSRTLTVSAVDATGDTAGSSSATINLVRANDTPSLTSGAVLASVAEDTSNPAGATVSSLFASRFSDTDATQAPFDTLAAVAVTADASASSQGAWQYSTDGSNWYDVGAVTTDSALVLSASTGLRFVPTADWNGTPGNLSVHAVDSTYGGSFTSGASRATFDTTTDGQTSAVSASAVSLSTSVSAVNDVPTFSGAPADVVVTEDQPSNVDLSVVTLADIDSSGAGFTLTLSVGAGSLAATSGGGVTVSPGGGGTLVLTGTVSNIDAYLNNGSNIQYTGVANANGDNVTSLTITANDQNGSGNLLVGTLNVDITPVNDLPTIKGSAGGTVNEDGSIALSGFSIADIDGDTVRIRVQSDNGSLSLDNSTGTTVHSTGADLQFSGSVADAGAALNTLRYQADANFNGTDDLSVEISDDNGATWQIYTVEQQGLFYNPTNGHYYEYVSAPGITWEAARDAAAASTIYGLNGYLVTATSAEENSFIAPRLGGNGWMGASDAGSEGVWRWVTGPEAGTQFWSGDPNAGANSSAYAGSSFGGGYANWVSGEPNNADFGRGGEDVAHFYSSGPNAGYWNDFSANNTASIGGYIVEYGGAGFGALTAAPVRITVTSVNDAPLFTSSAVTVALIDNAEPDTFATATGSLVASDDFSGAPNEGGTLTYGISGGSNSAGSASLTGSYGTLTVNQTTGAYSFVPDADAINTLPAGSAFSDSFTVTVSDGQGGLTTQQFTLDITPANDRPVGVGDTASITEASGIANGVAGTSASGNVLSNDTDIDSTDTPVVNGAVVQARESTAGSDAGVASGTDSSDGLVVTGLYGSLHIGADGSYTYAADETNAAVQALRITGQTLTERFTYTQADSGGLTSEADLTITIDGRNDTPVAQDDLPEATEQGGVFNATPGAPATGNVLDNDSDVDSNANGETKTVSALRTGAEADSGTAGTVGVVLTGTYGSLTLGDDGEFTYVVDETNTAVQALRLSGQTLTDSFTYTVTDTGGLSDQATLTVTVKGSNDNPVAVDDTGTAFEASEVFNGSGGAEATGNVLDNDSDVDSVANGETKTVSAVRTGLESGSGTSGTVGGVLTGSYGEITLNSDGSYTYVIDETNPAVQALRLSGQVLTDSFTYTVSDTGGLTDQATLTITLDGRNDNPVANSDAAIAVEAGGVSNGTAGANGTGNVLTNDTDVDGLNRGETATVTAVRTGAENGGGNTGAVGGSLAGNYGQLRLNADGSFSYTVDNNNPQVEALRIAGQTLTDRFTYTVTDAGGLTDQAELTITIQGKNDAPVADFSGIDQVWDFGKPFSLELGPRFSDVDSAANGEAFRFSVSGLPAGMSVDPATGRIFGAPSGIGRFNVTITASDGAGVSVSRQFSFEVLPPPVQVSPSPAPLSLPLADPAGPAPTSDISGSGNALATVDVGGLPEGTIDTGLGSDGGSGLGQGQGFLAAGAGEGAGAGTDGTSGAGNGTGTGVDAGAGTGANGNGNGDGNAASAEGNANANNAADGSNAKGDAGSRGAAAGADRVVMTEGSTRVTETTNADGKVTSLRATVQVNVGADGQVLFDEGQTKAFDIVGLSVASINPSGNGLTVLVADEARNRDTLFYTSEMGDGSLLPDWIKVDRNTGTVSIGNPPPGTDELTVRVKAISSDGSARVLEIELKLKDLFKRGKLGDAGGPDAPLPVGFVPLADQVAAEVSTRDAYGEQLMAMLVEA